MTNSSKLWVVGDSFSVINQDDYCEEIWPVILAKNLQFDLYNQSCVGTSQDWAFRIIRDWQFNISPEDQLIVVLTHPSRFWFFEDRPDLSNRNIVDFDKAINNQDRANAARYFIQYIQRPELDIQQTDHRLGWLSNLVYKNNWRKPIIILGFAQTIYENLYPNLIFSYGNLFAINKAEELGDIKNKDWDARYNHLCLSNHSILAKKIEDTIKNQNNLDLTSGFKEKIYSNELINNDSLALCELSIKQLEIYKKLSGHTESWLTRFRSK